MVDRSYIPFLLVENQWRQKERKKKFTYENNGHLSFLVTHLPKPTPICISNPWTWFQITGIYNSIENESCCAPHTESKPRLPETTVETDSGSGSVLGDYSEFVPNLTTQSLDLKPESEKLKSKKQPPSLTLDLRKSYDFNPSSTPCNIR